jgi:electron transfer flavoprotein beta subunit
MTILVCIKQVPDVSAPISIRNGQLSIDTDRMVLNAYDASAVEEALVLTEAHGGQVDVVLIGPEKAKETIRKALAMGAEQGFHIVLEEPSGMDSESFASILAAFLKTHRYDTVFTGKQSQDSDAGLTGSMLASKAGLPYAANAVGITANGDGLLVKRQGDAGQEMIRLGFPCLVTCSNDMNNPRIPSLKGIMASKKKTVESITLSDLSLDAMSMAGKTRVTGYTNVPGRPAGKKFEADPADLAKQVVGLLLNEAKVI